ncbi:4-hydroxy-tetrahydrodipicolinate reductase [Rhizobium sp. EC-SD404]|uniref:4-hydroxy-tetrahydrodipicolinate reductase n=1 Tax=Rhizobium sp. EC-SD404 TaxID=2038389 RepID=UPI00125934FF|nr:4-hydroxy-tetrahydrodipicolinate reductase [Rhizobium sp. EC-SD404]VVT31791.1 4-hydroxy-tetrahydrodipicolinate reductase [Rhizobium sp. EC-SD404]
MSDMKDLKLVVAGAGGRMGRALIQSIDAVPGVVLAGAIDRPGAASIGADAGQLAGLGANGVIVTDDPEAALADADGVLDFTAPEATVALARRASTHGLVHIIGTTGCSEDDDAAIREAATGARIVKSGNMSLGVNLLAVLVEEAARALEAADWDIEVLEMHHRHKVDAPSGTALLLGKAAAHGRAIDLVEKSVRVRDGHTGARPEGTIGFATLRGGSVVGEHTVLIAGEGETIELTHKATDRAIFARGAVKAALWASRQQPGLYSMIDVLGLKGHN